MPLQRLAPDAILEKVNLVGDLATVQNDPDDIAGLTWMTASDTSSATSLRTSFPTPAAALTGTQEFRARVRRVGGTDNPPLNLELWINGVSTLVGPSVTVTDTTTGQIVSWTWDAGTYDAASVECRINSPSTGGKPATRATCEVEAIEWNANTVTPPPNPPTNLTATADADSINLSWSAPTAGEPVTSYSVLRNGTNAMTGDNATFTNSLGDWTISAGTATSSAGVARITADSTSLYAFMAPRISVTAGSTISGAADVRNITGARGAYVGFFWYDSAGNAITPSTSTASTAISSTFTRLSISATVPAGATQAMFRLYGGGSGGTNVFGDVHEWDNVFVSGRAVVASGLTATTHDDATAVPGTQYTYTVRSVGAGGESLDSNSATAQVQEAPPVLYAAADTLTSTITDAVSQFRVPPSSSDGITTSITDQGVRAVTLDNKTAGDTLSARVSETTQFSTVSVSASDSITSSITDVGVTDSATPEVIGYDMGYDQAYDGTADVPTISIVASDSLAVSLVETSSLGTMAVSGSDSLATALSESRAIFASLSASDAVTTGLSEARAFGTIGVASSDTLSSSIAESGQSHVRLSSSDSVFSSLTESRSFGTVSVSGADSLTTTTTDTSTVFNDRVGADQAAVLVLESSSLEIGGLFVKESTEGLSTSVTETSSFGNVQVASSDTLTTSLNESGLFNGVPVVASDTISAGLLESTSFGAVSVSATDSVASSLGEVANRAVALTRSDTLAASLTESQALFVTRAVTDALGVGITDTGTFSTTSVTASDILRTSLTEANQTRVFISRPDTLTTSLSEGVQFAPITISSSDTLSTSLGESAGIFYTRPGSDAIAASITETTGILISGGADKVAGDSFTAGVAEQAVVSISLSRTDSLGTSLTEGTGFNAQPIATSDALSTSVTESREFSTINIVSNDTFSTSISDNGAFAPVAVVAFDNLNAQVAEGRSLFVTRTASEVTQVSLVEASANVASGTSFPTASDSFSVGITESAALAIAQGVAANDSVRVAVTDSSSIAPVDVTASDSLTISVSEAALTYSERPGLDGLGVVLTETGSIAISGLVTVSVSDSVRAAIAEARQLRASLSAQDTARPAISDASAKAISGLVTLVSSDQISVRLTETAAGVVSLSASDTVRASITEGNEVSGITINSTDSVAVSLSERAYWTEPGSQIIWGYHNGQWVRSTARVWNGTAWEAPRVWIYDPMGGWS